MNLLYISRRASSLKQINVDVLEAEFSDLRPFIQRGQGR